MLQDMVHVKLGGRDGSQWNKFVSNWASCEGLRDNLELAPEFEDVQMSDLERHRKSLQALADLAVRPQWVVGCTLDNPTQTM